MWDRRPACLKSFCCFSGGWSAPEGASVFCCLIEAGEGVIPLPPREVNSRGSTLNPFSNLPGLDSSLQAGQDLSKAHPDKSGLRASELVFIVSGPIRAPPNR